MYDVFISFTRQETRTDFASHIYAALSKKHIKPFIHTKDHRTRNEILSERSLLEPIEKSQLCLIIFSPNYGSSRRCLTELENILICSRKHGKKVLLVFYKVHPSEVRNQTGRFGLNFAGRHEGNEDTERVLEWRAALKEAADLLGLHLNDHTPEPEREFIDEIVLAVSRELKPIDTIVTLGFEHGYRLDYSSSGLRLSGTKSGAKEWGWLVVSFLFEGLSATFDQVGYTLTGMVMAYVALLLFVVELTLKARKKMLTWAGLPRFRKGSTPAHSKSRKVIFVVSVVELFGLATAIWQCFCSTRQYVRHPLKICLLPLLFVSCVIVSKCMRERRKKGQE